MLYECDVYVHDRKTVFALADTLRGRLFFALEVFNKKLDSSDAFFDIFVTGFRFFG